MDGNGTQSRIIDLEFLIELSNIYLNWKKENYIFHCGRKIALLQVCHFLVTVLLQSPYNNSTNTTHLYSLQPCSSP
jgi:hypothetical protein